MKITSKGQVTIPIEIRDRLGLHPSTEIEFEVEGTVVRIRKLKTSKGRGKTIVEHMRGKATTRLSTDEILSLTRR